MPNTPQPLQAGGEQTPPMGSSPATGPVPNRGFEAAGLQRLGVVTKQLEELLPLLGASSEQGQAVLKALNLLVKHVPIGSVSPQAEKNTLEQAMMKAIQNGKQMQALKAPGGAAPGEGQPGAAMPPITKAA